MFTLFMTLIDDMVKELREEEKKKADDENHTCEDTEARLNGADLGEGSNSNLKPCKKSAARRGFAGSNPAPRIKDAEVKE
jgi:hypothetical protein